MILSGGLDSTTLLYHLRAEGHEVRAISVNYGQRHDRELQAAAKICRLTQTPQEVVDLTGVAPLFGANALTDVGVDVPHGEYDAATMKVTTVPNRNMIMLSIAIGRALSIGYEAVAFGAHSGEYTPYADCSPKFAAAMNVAANACDRDPIQVLAPFVTWNKAMIVTRGQQLEVPFRETWSCYAGSLEPCGECGTCRDRKNAFAEAGIADPLTH